MYFTGRYLARLECLLTEQSLIVRKGIFVRVEKTVPLDKITDLGMVQGPIMRYLNIEKVTVETAGQSSQGALIGLYGIKDAAEFRDAVLAQRDSLRLVAGSSPGPELLEEETGGIHDVLISIRDSLSRIETVMASSKASDE